MGEERQSESENGDPSVDPTDRRSEEDRRAPDERRAEDDRRGSGLRTPMPPGKSRPYGFRSFDDRRSGEERRFPEDRRWALGESAVTLSPEELEALLTPTDE